MRRNGTRMTRDERREAETARRMSRKFASRLSLIRNIGFVTTAMAFAMFASGYLDMRVGAMMSSVAIFMMGLKSYMAPGLVASDPRNYVLLTAASEMEPPSDAEYADWMRYEYVNFARNHPNIHFACSVFGYKLLMIGCVLDVAQIYFL